MDPIGDIRKVALATRLKITGSLPIYSQFLATWLHELSHGGFIKFTNNRRSSFNGTISVELVHNKLGWSASSDKRSHRPIQFFLGDHTSYNANKNKLGYIGEGSLEFEAAVSRWPVESSCTRLGGAPNNNSESARVSRITVRCWTDKLLL